MVSRLLAFVFIAGPALGIAPVAAAPGPAPSPEARRLEVMVGEWETRAEIKPGPLGPAGTVTIRETCEWFEGGHAVVCRSEGNGPMGAFKATALAHWDASARRYRYAAIDSLGMAEHAEGTVDGDTWTWTSRTIVDGRPVDSRWVVKVEGPDTRTTAWATRGAGDWLTLSEGRQTRVRTSPP